MPAAADDRLDSWKEIAAYVNRGVRTVRRWEREEGLPVHRHVHRELGSVYAYKSEIDAWRQSGSRRPPPRSPDSARGTDPSLGPIKSIAVLPFTNRSTDRENEYFADGLTDEVTADLSKVRALRVISRTSAMTFKGTAKDVKTIARELGVRYILEGSVRRAGSRLRITAQLIEASTDHHLWADNFDGSAEDVFAFQERLARVIVEALKLQLTADENRRLAERPIANLHAYECYLRARQEGWRWRKDAIDHAFGSCTTGWRSSVRTPGSTRRWASRTSSTGRPGSTSVNAHSRRPRRVRGRSSCSRPNPPRGSNCVAASTIRAAESRRRFDDLKAALEIDPNSADTLLLLSNCYLISGRVSIARPLIDRLLAVDPLTPLSRCLPGFADAMDGNFAAAVEPYRQMFEMDPGNPMGRLFYVWALALNRRMDAIGAIVEGFPAETRDSVPARLAFFLAHALAANRRDASRGPHPGDRAITTATDVFPRILAQGYALAGDAERALHWLAIAVERGFINHPFLARHDPFFERIRNHPAFQKLIDTVRDRWESFEP